MFKLDDLPKSLMNLVISLVSGAGEQHSQHSANAKWRDEDILGLTTFTCRLFIELKLVKKGQTKVVICLCKLDQLLPGIDRSRLGDYRSDNAREKKSGGNKLESHFQDVDDLQLQ